MAAQARPAAPDFVQHNRLLNMQRSCLQHLDADLVLGPLDLHREAHHLLGHLHVAGELVNIIGGEALETRRLVAGRRVIMVMVVVVVVVVVMIMAVFMRMVMIVFVALRLGRGHGGHRILRRRLMRVAIGAVLEFLAADRLDQLALGCQVIAVGHDLALGERFTEPPGGADGHAAIGRLAQATTGRLRLDQRLDQHRHRGVDRADLLVLHVAHGLRRPQRPPACAHGGQEIRLALDAEKCLELSGEGRALGVFHQRGRPHGKPHPGLRRQRPVSVEQLGLDVGGNRLGEKADAHLGDRAARFHEGQAHRLFRGIDQSERFQLVEVGIRAEHETAWGREPGMAERRLVGGLGAEPFRIRRRFVSQPHHELRHVPAPSKFGPDGKTETKTGSSYQFGRAIKPPGRTNLNFKLRREAQTRRVSAASGRRP